MPRGGARPNSGPKKGSKRPHTLIKDLQREHLRQQVFAAQDAIVAAQIRAAIGLAHFFLRDEHGQFKRITDEDEIEQALNSGNPNAFWIDTKDPNTAASKDLLDRALDKPTESVEQMVTGALEISWKTPK
jgi:hypothetical protein